jgi:AraC-like DNA-binding protein
MMPTIDRVVFATGTVRIGAFRCPVDDHRFRDSGPIPGNTVVFPRRGVWIRQAGSRPVAADPSIATIYNRGRRYDRAAISAEGDQSDWFELAPEAAVALARELDPEAPDEPERAFRREAAATSHALYQRQRRLFLAAERGGADPLAIEEGAVAVMAAVLGGAAGQAGEEPALSRAQRDLVERAKAELSRDVAAPTSLSVLSARLGASAPHICRVFRRGTNQTLHQYRVGLRLRTALEGLEATRGDLSRLSAELGFASHAHFTAVMRRRWGVTATRCRAMLGGGGG